MYQDIIRSNNFIANGWHGNPSATPTIVIDKYHGTELAKVSMADVSQMELAINAAVSGFKVYREWSSEDRSELIKRLADALRSKRKDFEELVIAEAGKPRSYAANEIDRCIFTLETAARAALTFGGEMIPMDMGVGKGKTAYTKRFPIGPIAAISPFNFPLNLALHKIAPALATGCSMVLKPSPLAPLSALAFAGLAEECGCPSGVLNVVLCDIPVAEKLVRDERMKMLSFTGSPAVGWALKNMAGKKKVALELGGNAAVLVDDSANIREAADRIAMGANLYAGQTCISTQRVYAHREIFESLKAALIESFQALNCGDPNDENVAVGPVISKEHYERISLWVDQAVTNGARVLVGGKRLDDQHHLFAPTLLTNTNQNMKVVKEEVFGPVTILEEVVDFQTGLSAINNSEFGLQAGVFTERINHINLAHNTLEVGGIMINNIPGFRIDHMPYGGVKASGLGREGIRYTMEDMSEPRLMVF